MVRKTETNSKVSQYELDKMWDMIEADFEEDWRVERNGDCVLVVDEEKMEEILWENFDEAVKLFGVKKIDVSWYDGLTDMPEHLCGTYTIKGIYAEDLRYLPGDIAPRTYHFSEEF